jgi:hypothetical protein
VEVQPVGAAGPLALLAARLPMALQRLAATPRPELVAATLQRQAGTVAALPRTEQRLQRRAATAARQDQASVGPALWRGVLAPATAGLPGLAAPACRREGTRRPQLQAATCPPPGFTTARRPLSPRRLRACSRRRTTGRATATSRARAINHSSLGTGRPPGQEGQGAGTGRRPLRRAQARMLGVAASAGGTESLRWEPSEAASTARLARAGGRHMIPAARRHRSTSSSRRMRPRGIRRRGRRHMAWAGRAAAAAAAVARCQVAAASSTASAGGATAPRLQGAQAALGRQAAQGRLHAEGRLPSAAPRVAGLMPGLQHVRSGCQGGQAPPRPLLQRGA